MNFRAHPPRPVRASMAALMAAGLATLAGPPAFARAAPGATAASKAPSVLAQAAAPAPAASAPGADAQPENRETPARPASKRRGVGVVISMNLA